jgi:hypothetical protein
VRISELNLLVTGLETLIQRNADAQELAHLTSQMIWDIDRGRTINGDTVHRAETVIERILSDD